MKFKITPIKVCAAIILAVAAFGFSLSSLNAAVADYERRHNSLSSFPHHSAAPIEVFGAKTIQPTSEPLARLFQLLFILFIISPPLIVVLLFLIWKELRAGNKMK